MYYETKKKGYMSFIIVMFLGVIIIILINLINKVDEFLNINNLEIEETSIDTAFEEFNVENLIENVSYSVVGVSKLNKSNTAIFVENSEEKLGMGSGIILTSNGYILTNYEISGEVNNTCYVTLSDGKVYPSKTVWVNKQLDIGLIKIAVDNLVSFSFGNSDDISIGEEIYMVSNASGYDFKKEFTTGVISKVSDTLKTVDGENIEYAEDIMKISIEIKSENTGSPIVNKDGELLGIASSKLNSVIPINRIKNILNRLENEDKFEEAYLGIYGFDNDVLKYLNTDYTLNIGVYIEKIEEDSPVFEKVLVGDIITKIDDCELRTMQELSEYLYSKNVGDKVEISVIRDAKELKIDCILEKKK
jgi:S1-C subfamily serine protease